METALNEIKRCKTCKMCDTIIKLHERIKLLESAVVEIYGRLLPNQTRMELEKGVNKNEGISDKRN